MRHDNSRTKKCLDELLFFDNFWMSYLAIEDSVKELNELEGRVKLEAKD
jgi:hypothetical protein